MEQPKKQRGGARQGAGRKIVEPRRIVNLRLPLADLDAIQAKGKEINQFYREAGKEKLMRENDVPSES